MKGEILFQPVLVKTRVREANVKNVNETKSEEKKKKKKKGNDVLSTTLQ